MSEKINSNALTPEMLARLLSNAGQRVITEEQVRTIAQLGDLLSAADTINLTQYTAFLAKSEGKSNDDE